MADAGICIAFRVGAVSICFPTRCLRASVCNRLRCSSWYSDCAEAPRDDHRQTDGNAEIITGQDPRTQTFYAGHSDRSASMTLRVSPDWSNGNKAALDQLVSTLKRYFKVNHSAADLARQGTEHLSYQ